MADSDKTKPFYNSTIPSDWEVRKLVNCCSIKGEYGINAGAVEYSDELPTYIRITDINDDGYYSNVKQASVSDENSKNFILQKGDIIFARTGATVGKTYLYDEKDGILVFAGFLIRFRPDENKLSVRHLKYFTDTKTYWDWVKTISMRSGQPGINAEEYGSLKIPLPPLPEQKAIAHVLGLMDRAINHHNQLIAQKELRKKWLMQNLLTGKRRLKGFSGKWKEIKISELLGKAFRYVEWNDEHTYQLVSIRRRYRGLFERGDFFGHQIEVKKIKSVHHNDFLISKRQVSHGAWGIVPPEFHDWKVSDEYDCLTVKDPKKLNMQFWAWFCQNPHMTHHAFLASNGVHIEKLIFDFDAFKKRKVLIPPSIEEQAAIAEVLQAADKEIQLLKTKTEKLREQKKGMMQQLLTGKKRLKIEGSEFKL